MAEKSLRERLGWKPGQRVLLLGLPSGVEDPFQDVDHANEAAAGQFDLLVGFTRDQAALRTIAPLMLASAAEDAKVWLCYPKGTSRVKTDLNRDAGWEPMFAAGWIVVAIASVDATWSAVRFRPRNQVKSIRYPAAAKAKL
jgi:hypothetical protein